MLVDRAIAVAVPLQIVCAAGVAIASGVGFTVISTVMAEPVHVPIAGVIVYLTTAGAFVLFVRV